MTAVFNRALTLSNKIVKSSFQFTSVLSRCYDKCTSTKSFSSYHISTAYLSMCSNQKEDSGPMVICDNDPILPYMKGGQSPTSVIPWKSILEESKDQKESVKCFFEIFHTHTHTLRLVSLWGCPESIPYCPIHCPAHSIPFRRPPYGLGTSGDCHTT